MSSSNRDVELLPAVAFGVLIGMLTVASMRAPEVPVDGLLAAAAAVLVGWWINVVLRRRVELDRVPIEYVDRVGRKIDDLIIECLYNAASKNMPQVLADHLVPLSREIHWLDDLAGRVDGTTSKVLTRELLVRYLDMKKSLTDPADGKHPDLVSAERASRDLRVTALALRWHLCRQFLDRQPNVVRLAKAQRRT